MSETDKSFETRRTRRGNLSDAKVRKQSVLEELKQARASGKSYRKRVDDLVQDVYMEIDDEEYEAKKQESRGFVEDDDGAGYYDEDDSENEFGEDDRILSKKSKTNKKDKQKAGTIKHHFRVITSKQLPQNEKSVHVDEDNILKECLADIIGTSTSEIEVAQTAQQISTDNSIFDPLSDLHPANELNQFRVPTPDIEAGISDHIEPKNDGELRGDPVQINVERELAPTFTKKTPQLESPSRTPSKQQKKRDREEEPCAAISNDCSENRPNKIQRTDDLAVTPGTLNFYFIDAFEDVNRYPGTVYLFGRVKNLNGGFDSCCLVIKNISQQLFFVKREKSISSGKEVTKEDLYNDVQRTLKAKFGITNFKCKANLISRKFISPDKTLLKENQTLEVWVNDKRISGTFSGDCFSHVMNTTTTTLERLLVECEIHGPCWLNVQEAVLVESPVSHCQLEYFVDMDRMKSISMAANADVAPPISMISINVLTALNAEKKENQVVMISLIQHTCNLEKGTVFDVKLMNNKRFCIVTRLKSGLPLPFDLDNQLKANGIANLVRKVGDEMSLLNVFLAKIEELNPDLILGHDLNAQLILLQAAMEKYKLKKWDRFGRLKRSIQIPKMHTKAASWELTAGRLCLDSKTTAMELVRARSYEMEELVPRILKINGRNDLNVEQISEPFLALKPKVTLIELIRWNWNENFFAMKIVEQLNAIPLFVQITQIVGGVMSKTMMGGRAERNDYLLLHAFFKNNYVPPDKQSFTKKGFTQNDKINGKNNKKIDQTESEQGILGEEEEATEQILVNNQKSANPNTKKPVLNKKTQYTGGLVLEPKMGLYETFIVLLDFNSLYPSIIQEFNICFTTVDKAFDDLTEPELPLPPGSSQPDGILKTEIRKLVSRRKEVKDLMNKERIGTDKYKQYNIRQMGLKLTANSMYGCLGFQYSRFYAKTLAAMITAKGRELLMHTKTLVENEKFAVIYGDTDSIMVNTNTIDFNQAKQIGQKLKQLVNKNYSLLELDIDGIYKRLLLLKKKKYAAMSVDLNDERIVTQELKGLDIVRRDWSQITKDTGNEIVHLILSSADRDLLVEGIRSTLSECRKNLESGKVALDKFEILKQLTRNPSDYTDMKSQPHAAVAIRLNDSKKFRFRHGDIVRYIICQDGTNNPATQRAYHHSEILANENLTVDAQYYLAQQIHPVVSRLCEPIEEIDAYQIAELLGLDPSSYRRKNAQSNIDAAEENNEPFAVGQQQNFNECEGFTFQCPSCNKFNVIRSATTKKDDGTVIFGLAQCMECLKELNEQAGHIKKQLTLALRQFIKKNLQDPIVCDDVVCGAECSVPTPQQITPEGIVCAKCQNGIAKKRYTYKRLYDQQCFFKEIASLSDQEKKVLEFNPSKSWINEHYKDCLEIVNRSLEMNAFNIVDLAVVFAPLLRIRM